jgi:hypothetical protein
MLSGVWRRIRLLVRGSPSSRGPSIVRPPHVPDLPYTKASSKKELEAELRPPGSAVPADATLDPTEIRPDPRHVEARETAAAEAPPRSIEDRAESLATRLVEDETLHGNLSDDEFKPLLDWAMTRIGELAESCSKLPAAQADTRFERASQQLLDLLRVVDLAVGQRAASSQAMVTSRLEMLDTFLGPPLLEEDAAARARSRLEALVAQPPERLQAAQGVELTRGLAQALR